MPKQEMQQIIAALQRIVPYLNGLMIASWLLTMSANWVLARKLLNITNDPPTLHNFYLVALAVLMALGQIFNNSHDLLAMNAAIVLLVPCFITGLATINFVANIKRIHKLMLVIFYLSMLLFPVLILLIIFLGIFEPWLDIRNRCTKTS